MPWVDQRPTQAPAHPPLARPCRAADLRVHLFLQGATGSLVGGVQLTNLGRPCSLLGWPGVSLVGPAARMTHWRVKQVARSPEPRDVLADPPGSLRALGHGKSASAWLFWSNWCGPGATPTGDPGTLPSALRLRLPSGTTLSIALLRAPRCDAPQAPSTISVAPFRPVSPSLPPSSRLPLKLAIVGPRPITVKPGVHAFIARRGRPFRYRVAMTNTSSHTFRFGASCRVYVEQLAGSGPPLAFVLNCRGVGPIEPRRKVLFEIVLPIVASAHLGGNGITFQLAPKTFEAPFAQTEVWVEP